MGFGGQTGLNPLKIVSKSVFIEKKIVSDPNILKFDKFFLIFQNFSSFWKVEKSAKNEKIDEIRDFWNRL